MHLVARTPGDVWRLASHSRLTTATITSLPSTVLPVYPGFFYRRTCFLVFSSLRHQQKQTFFFPPPPPPPSGAAWRWLQGGRDGGSLNKKCGRGTFWHAHTHPPTHRASLKPRTRTDRLKSHMARGDGKPTEKGREVGELICTVLCTALC